MGTFLFANPCSVTVSGTTSHLRDGQRYQVYATSPSTVDIDRSAFDAGDGLVAAGAGAVVSVRNSVIANQCLAGNQAGESALVGGAFLGNGPPGAATASFTTFVNAPLRCGDATPACVAGGQSVGVCVSDSILVTNNGMDPVTGPACELFYSVVNPHAGALTGSNNKVNVDPLFIDLSAANYALQSASPAIDAADPTAINPYDILGVSRPQGARDDMGAFEFKP
jgi:hypothetical protein